MAANPERRVTRREPIKVSVDIGDGSPLNFYVHPVGWRARIDMGDALLRMWSAGITQLAAEVRNEAGDVVGLESSLFESHIDYKTLLGLAFPNANADDFDVLDYDQLIEVLTAAYEVNGLERLAHMLDPDRKKDQTTGAPEAETTAPAAVDGKKTGSHTVSG